MANVKINQLPEQITISDSDVVVIETPTSTNKMTISNLKSLLGVNDNESWIKIDSITTPIQVTSTDYLNPTVIPMIEDYTSSKIYAVEFTSTSDTRASQFIIFRGYGGGSIGSHIYAGTGPSVSTVNRVRKGTQMGFYNASSTLYIQSVYVLA
jgi:tRNA(Ile2) C34 agmatinyltransferase TiaS